MWESILIFYGILGSTASLKPYFDKLRNKLSVEAKHEKVLFDCCRKAIEDVTGKDLSKFGLKGGVAVLQQIDEYFESDNEEATSNYIRRFFSKSNLDLKAIQEKFRRHLAECKSPEVLTYVSLLTKEETGDIKRKVYEIDDKLAKIAPAQRPAPPEGIPTPPKPYFAHPYPLQENFTGREAERKELAEWFTKGTEPMFAYVAIGGMGKSALTWYWLQEDIIKKGLAPEGIIWWSFYDREARFETFLMKAIQYVSKGKIDAKGIASNRDRMETLNTLLSGNRFLLVLDGVERVLRAYAGLGSPYQGDEVKEDERGDFRSCVDPNVGTFLQWLCSGNRKTKTLLTSRLCPKELDGIDGCFHKHLKEMNKEDAVDFFHRQGVKGRRDEIETAGKPYGYHPLSLRLLSGMIVKDPKFQGDIIGWTRHNPLPQLTGTARQHRILELAYNSLDKEKQALLSKLSAFRNPMEYDSISIFNEFEPEEKFDEALIELQDRGLLLRDAESNKYDLHPIVRRYCYDRLKNKKGVHSQLRDYFKKVPKPEKVDSLDDLAPVIELYHHTVSSGRYDEAFDIFLKRLSNLILYQFGATSLRVDLLRALFPDGEDHSPRLNDEKNRARTLNALANSYSLSGRPKKALPLFEKLIEFQEKVIDCDRIAIVPAALAIAVQIPLGELKAAESNFRRSIDLSRETNNELTEAMGHSDLGLLLTYLGKYEEAEKELGTAIEMQKTTEHKQTEGISWLYSAIRALLTSRPEEALKAAKRARKLADVRRNEQDIIRAEWILGSASLTRGNLESAEEHLNEALLRDRRINLVIVEPDILLEMAKLRFKQGHKEDALKLAKEALGIADRCEYRLKQADIHNFLAEFYLDAKDFSKAKEHVEIAKERAACGYVPAMKKAEELAEKVQQSLRTK